MVVRRITFVRKIRENFLSFSGGVSASGKVE
jgi:hypothetical protein